MMTRLLVLAFVLVLAIPLPARAASDRANEPLSPLSCFGAPDYCVKNFAKTHDRDYYDLCLLSARICQSYSNN
jgi:hypothetical protein